MNTRGGSAPTVHDVGDIWDDNSVSPTKRYRWDGSAWVHSIMQNPQKADAKPGSETVPKQERPGCWHCWNIEAHEIAWVIGVKDEKGIPMNTPADIPYNHCPACGRKLKVTE